MRSQPYRASQRADWFRVLLILAVLMPLVIIFFLPGVGVMLGMMWFWLILLLTITMMWLILGVPRQGAVETYAAPVAPPEAAPAPVAAPPIPLVLGPRPLSPAEIPPE